VYRVSPTLPLQTYRFGNWTAGGGLNWPSEGLYMRRNNLQGHTFRAAHVKVNRNFFNIQWFKVVPMQIIKRRDLCYVDS